METQLKQRLVGLTVIFSLAVIFLPMLLDGSGLAPRPVEIEIPPAPVIESTIKIEEKIIELEKKTATLADIQPLIVDEISDPPAEESTSPETEAVAAGDDKASNIAPVDSQPQARTEPEKPKVERKPAQADAPETVAASKQEPVKAVKKSSPKVTKPAAKPQVGGISWVIQTGSFQQKEKAYQQRDRIRKSRLAPVFIEKYQHNGKLNYRVRMGPFLTRQKATIVKNKLRAKYNIKAILMKYEK